MGHTGVEERLVRRVRRWSNQVHERFSESPQRRDRLLPLLYVARITHGHDHHLLSVDAGGKKRRRRCRPEDDDGHQLVRSSRDEVPVEFEYFARPRRWVQYHAGQYGGPDGMQSILERRDDAKVAASSAEPPEEVRVLFSAGP